MNGILGFETNCFCFCLCVIEGMGDEFNMLIICHKGLMCFLCSFQGLSYLIDPDLGCCSGGGVNWNENCN